MRGGGGGGGGGGVERKGAHLMLNGTGFKRILTKIKTNSNLNEPNLTSVYIDAHVQSAN